MRLNRRSLVKGLIAGGGGLRLGSVFFNRKGRASGIEVSGLRSETNASKPGIRTRMDAKSYLDQIVYTREEASNWLTGTDTGYIGEKYDPDIGWVPHAGYFKHGVDDAICEYSYEASGARRITLYADRACRINTYGDSFTHCDQVSDCETWQERLAAHLCEPVRNFGVSGHSVCQMYVRMQREESRTPARYIILNIYSDDHYRHLYGWASLATPRSESRAHVLRRPTMPYVKVNPAAGEFREFANPCATPESLFNLCNPEWVYEHFKDDFRLKLILAQQNIKQLIPERSYAEINSLAEEQGIAARANSAESLAAVIEKLYTRAALFSTMRIVEKVEEFAARHQKKVLYVLSYTVAHAAAALAQGHRFDQEFVDFLERKRLPYVDDLDAHRADLANFKIGVAEYLKRYYIGHYNPLGNFFQAFAIKGKLTEMLEPRPLAYPNLVAQPSAGTNISDKVVNPGHSH